MKKQLLILFAALICISAQHATAQSVSRLVGASPFQDSLWVMDTTTFAVKLRAMPYPSAGANITGINGMAKNPNSGTIYVAFKQYNVTGRLLGKLNLLSNSIAVIGNLGDNFASITFRGDSLFGLTGDGATVPETVYLIDTATAGKTLFRALGNGADGESMSYNPVDDMIYHWSGNGTIIYEKFSPVNAADPVIDIPLIGATYGEAFGSVYTGNNKFLVSNIGSTFNRYSTDGTVSGSFGNSPDDIRGLVFYTCERTITGTDHFCAGDSTELTISASFSYQWIKDGTDIPGATSQSYFVSTPGVYNVRIHDVCGTDTTIAVTVQQHNLPSVALSGNTSYCTGSSVTLTGSSGGSSQWYLNGTPIAGATSNTYAASAAGVYNMTKTNLNGCSDSAAVGITITENALPVVLVTGNTSYCAGNSVTLTGTSGGSSQWYLNGAPIAGATSNTYTASEPGVYNMIKTNSNGCADSSSVGITVMENPLPVVVLNGNTGYCAGDSVTLTGNSGGTSQWYLNGAAISGATSNTYTASEPGVYNMIKTNSNGCADSAAIGIMVTENPLPDVSIAGAPSAMTCIDQELALSGEPAGGNFSGPGVTPGSPVFDPSQTGTGSFSVVYVYTDANGCTSSDTVVVAVADLPAVSASPAVTEACVYDSAIELTGIPAGGTFTGTGVSGTDFNPANGEIGANQLSYFYTDTNNCSNSSSFTITLDSCLALPELSADFELYPNPANAAIEIVTSQASETIVCVMDLTGKTVLSATMTGTITLDVSGLKNGTYSVQIQHAAARLTKKMVILH
jgi:hypothetical protein